MGRVILVMLGTLGLAACGPGMQNTEHPNYGQSEFDRDQGQCRQELSYQTNGATIVNPQLLASCMQAHGWTPQ